MSIVRAIALALSSVLIGIHSAAAQSPSFADPYLPITAAQRATWVVNGSIGVRSLAVGVISDAWLTAWNTPEEWGRGWSGIGKRYVSREASVTISNSIEAGLGAIWGEDPRYFRAPGASLGSRVGYAAKAAVLTRRRDGRLAPAWGRYTGTIVGNVVENTWLPPSATSPRDVAVRSTTGVLGRFGSNLFEEFWPDIKKRFRR
jgi:hypothetical protein